MKESFFDGNDAMPVFASALEGVKCCSCLCCRLLQNEVRMLLHTFDILFGVTEFIESRLPLTSFLRDFEAMGDFFESEDNMEDDENWYKRKCNKKHACT